MHIDEDDIDWDDLMDDIRQQRCVLFVGPDVVQVDGQPLQQTVRNYLKVKCRPGEIVQDYQRDGFFLFKDGTAKTQARRLFNRFFEKHTIDESIFRRILEIPFHLVVSINADTLLDDVAYKYGVPHRFDYFKSRNRATEEVEVPTSATPLFYNLCGCKIQDDSLLLDYEDLFQLLQSALGTPGLPQKLMETLASARTFVFLGFQFDKWHTQLLMRLLQGGRTSISSKVLSNHFPDDDTRAFLIKQFNIEFLGNDQYFFDKLYQYCKDEKILRRLEEPLGEDATEIVRFVQNNQLDKALEMLFNLGGQMNDDELKQTASLLMSRFRRLNDENDKGKMDSRDASVERNRIVDAILQFTKQIQHS